MKRLFSIAIALSFMVFSSAAWAGEFGVYVKVMEAVEGTFDNTVKALEQALSEGGLQVLASYEAGVEEGCGMRAHNIVAHSADYTEKIMDHGPWSAFALPLRVGVYEDEKGVNIAFANPASINRTVLGDGVNEDVSLEAMKWLSGIVSSSVEGKAVNEQIGQLRNKGRVGGMGGGDFTDKVEEIYQGTGFESVAADVKEGITSNDKDWTLVYTLPLERHGAVVYGVTRTRTEARAFRIAGEKRESDDYRCPGIDHVAAFPIEVIVYKEGENVKVVTLDEMYRMKVYFQDAGNWAFMKNIAMPGALEKEIVEMSRAKLVEKKEEGKKGFE